MIEALLHTLWQGMLVAIVVAFALRMIATSRPTARYLAALSGLLTIVLAWFITWSIVTQSAAPIASEADGPPPRHAVEFENTPQAQSNVDQGRGRPGSPPEVSPAPDKQIDWRPLCEGAWVLGVILMLIRAAFLLQGAARLRDRCEPLTEGDVFDLFHSLNPPSRVALLAGDVAGPCVVGLITPALLLPVSMLTDISITDWRMILAHEIAHIRRRDFWVNTLQLIIEALLFFNPAVWWLTRQIRIEREACCDAAAAHEPRAYAALLATLAETQLPAAALAATHRGTLVERIKRLVLPRHRPALRLPLFTFALLTIITFAALFGLQRTTDIAVSHFLTEKQVQQIAEVRREHGLKVVDPKAEENLVTIAGLVRTEVGEPLPENLRVFGRCNYQSPDGSGVASMQVTVKPDGTFEAKPRYFGTYSFEARAEGYAVSFAGSYEPQPGEAIDNVVITLKRGYTARVRLQGSDGQPITQADVKAYYQPPTGQAGWHHPADVTPTDDGLFAVHHAPVHAMEFAVRADGHQFQRTRVDLSPDQVATIELQAGQQTAGLVVDEHGNPIADAIIKLAYRGKHMAVSNGEVQRMETLTRTDEAGRFTIDTLRDDCRYELFAIAEGKHGAFIRNVRPGNTDLRATLGPAITVSGKVLGAVTPKRGKPYLHYVNPVVVNDGNYAHHHKVPLQIDGDVGTFTIDNLLPGTLRFYYGNHQPRLNITASGDDVVIDARVNAEGEPISPEFTTRPVVLRFAIDDGAAIPRGKLRVDTLPPGSPGYIPSWHDVEGRTVRIAEVPAPGKLHYQSSQLIGYWLPLQGQDIDIPAGESEVTIDMPVEPAGAAFGQVTDENGKPLEDFSPTLIIVKKAPSMDKPTFERHNEKTGGGRYFMTPLPLGGTYVVMAHVGTRYVASKPFTPTRRNPSHEVNLQLQRGERLEGKVYLPNGDPASGVEVSLHLSTPWSHGFGGPTVVTGRDGWFRMQHVNPDVPGEYKLKFEPMIHQRPAFVEIDDVNDPVIVRLEPGRMIEGVVVNDATGDPVEGIEVFAIASGWRDVVGYHEGEVKTDEAGRFRIGRLGPGKYQLSVRGANEVEHPMAFGGQSEKVEIRVERKK